MVFGNLRAKPKGSKLIPYALTKRCIMNVLYYDITEANFIVLGSIMMIEGSGDET